MRIRFSALGAVILPAMWLLAGCGGSAAAPASQAAPAASTANVFIATDMVEGSKNVPADQASIRSCVLSSRFPRNAEVVWRSRIYDPVKGDLLDDKAISSVQVKLATGKTLDMHYAAHPASPPGEMYWTASWVVPKDQPTGSFKYSIVATTADGRTGTWQPFSVAASLPTITEDILPDAPTAS